MLDRRDRGDLLPLAPGVWRAQDRADQAPEGVGDRECEVAPGGGGPHARQADPERGRLGKLLSPARRRVGIEHVRDKLQVSERRVCRALGQHRSTQRKRPRGRDDEERLTADTIELARQYGRYGSRKIAERLRSTAGWVVNDKRVERIWRREGLSSPSVAGSGWRTAPACGCGPSTPTTSGPTTLSRIAPRMDGSTGCSTSSTSSRTSAWRSG